MHRTRGSIVSKEGRPDRTILTLFRWYVAARSTTLNEAIPQDGATSVLATKLRMQRPRASQVVERLRMLISGSFVLVLSRSRCCRDGRVDA